jgi:SAM-dependent methyltransferase
MKLKCWYEDWFADERYLALYRHRNSEEASQALDLIESSTHIGKEAAILDLACGAGRHSIGLAKRGYTNITAIDLSPTLIREAKNNAQRENVNVHFFIEDMRLFHGSFDLVMNLFTSFGYFEFDNENEEVIEKASKSLNNNGFLIIDFLNASVIRKNIVTHDEKIINHDERIEQFREIVNNRVEKRIIIHSSSGSKEYKESVRLYDLMDFEKMFFKTGLIVKDIFGDYSGSPFDAGSSPRLFLVAQKQE